MLVTLGMLCGSFRSIAVCRCCCYALAVTAMIFIIAIVAGVNVVGGCGFCCSWYVAVR